DPESALAFIKQSHESQRLTGLQTLQNSTHGGAHRQRFACDLMLIKQLGALHDSAHRQLQFMQVGLRLRFVDCQSCRWMPNRREIASSTWPRAQIARRLAKLLVFL